MSDPSVTVAEAFKQFSHATVSAVRPDYSPQTFRFFIHFISAPRLRTRDACTIKSNRRRSACAPARARRCAQRAVRLQGTNSGEGRGRGQVEGRGTSRRYVMRVSSHLLTLLTREWGNLTADG